MATKKKAAKKKGHFKSAKSGKFISAEEAEQSPDTTFKLGKKKK